jgi:hypothetical protein
MARARKIHFSSLLLVLDSIDADIYAADLDTHEILYMNRHMGESFGGDFAGQVCYRVFRKEDSPCPHCTNARLLDEEESPRSVLVWEGRIRSPDAGTRTQPSDPLGSGRRACRSPRHHRAEGRKPGSAPGHPRSPDPAAPPPVDDRLKHARAGPAGAEPGNLLFLDLDGFKAVNDNTGISRG